MLPRRGRNQISCDLDPGATSHTPAPHEADVSVMCRVPSRAVSAGIDDVPPDTVDGP